MYKNNKTSSKSKTGSKKEFKPGKPVIKSFGKLFYFLIFLLSAISLMFTACSKIEFDFFGLELNKKPVEEPEPEQSFSEIESVETGTDNEPAENNPSDSDLPEPARDETVDIQDDEGTLQEPASSTMPIEDMRLFFSEGVNRFQEESYLISEYYFNKIKDNYLILQDHIFYYLAKSLLMQDKFLLSEEYYLKLIENYPDSIWLETANLEYADLFFIQEDYITAEEKYMQFMEKFPESEFYPYSLFQLAACQEKNGKFGEAVENLKKLWLQFPASSYSGPAYDSLARIIEENSLDAFTPGTEELYDRGELLFKSYLYADARKEFNKLLENSYSGLLTTELYCKTTFRIGMCYYNQNDYSSAKNYLLQSYQNSSTSSVADDCLYFLGRAYTNLDNDSEAISYYNKLLVQFPASNYGDDAYYRMGRIYSIINDSANAIDSFQKVFDKYPSGDMLDEALWELGWIQYKAGYYNDAKGTFINLASSFKGTQLEEKALFWKAKCQQKTGDSTGAVETCRNIIGLKSYSYYTFAAHTLAEELGGTVDIPEIDQDLDPQNPMLKERLPDVFTGLDRENPDTDGQVDHISKAVELMNLQFYSSASLEIDAGSGEIEENPGRVLEIANIYYHARDYGNCLRIIHKNQSKIKSNLDDDHIYYSYYLHYPYGFRDEIDKYSGQYGLDPLFMLAVIRQESAFVADAGSYAGAQGLMQIMPSTAQSIASRIGISGFNQSMLHEPDISINMGAYYLRQQLDSYNQNLVYCLGAYNGGPGAMSSWISKWGDRPPEEFIEYITYLETKDYIKKVLGNYYFYQMLYR